MQEEWIPAGCKHNPRYSGLWLLGSLAVAVIAFFVGVFSDNLEISKHAFTVLFWAIGIYNCGMFIGKAMDPCIYKGPPWLRWTKACGACLTDLAWAICVTVVLNVDRDIGWVRTISTASAFVIPSVWGIYHLIKENNSDSNDAKQKLEIAHQMNIQSFLSNVYALAWPHYLEMEKGISLAWLFAVPRFMERLYKEALRQAIRELHEQSSGYLLYQYYTPSQKEGGWYVTKSLDAATEEATLQQLIKDIPLLSGAYSWEFAEKAVAPISQGVIPTQENIDASSMMRKVWDRKVCAWTTKRVSR